MIVDKSRRFHFLRQQTAYGGCTSEPLAKPTLAQSHKDHRAFAVSIHGADELAARYEAEHDDYHAIMVKALADRLAEAFAEYLHLQARRDWYAGDEELSSDDLIAERFRGICPAFGYPACLDHTEKRTLFEPRRRRDRHRPDGDLRNERRMAVSGIYLAHPEARYFSGRIARDQLEDYAARKGFSSRKASGGWPRISPRRSRSRAIPTAEGAARRSPFSSGSTNAIRRFSGTRSDSAMAFSRSAPPCERSLRPCLACCSGLNNRRITSANHARRRVMRASVAAPR